KKFWRTGLERVADKEILVTLGMRGDGDEPMTEGTATELLERIVKDQRDIIENVTQKPAEQTPQVWALYKEVQDYYDKGMRVPDDVTLLLCDDNWGNLRKLPDLKEAPRKGGYGIYYHFDYVGGPRNYKWINTNPIQKVWEQMNLAYQYDANQIWIVNVGDLKPMEFPTEFFLDYAWNPAAIPSDQLKNYTINWVQKQFGNGYKEEIADLVDTYLKYAGRVKPELLNANTYSLTNYNEWGRVIADYDTLLAKAAEIKSKLHTDYQDSFYQLVFHPIEANCNLHHLYYAHAKNKLFAIQGRASTNFFADEVEKRFKQDAEITHYYNNVLAGGKWRHMMDQTHIGYTYWQQPDSNIMPKVSRIKINSKANLGLSIEGSEKVWTGKINVSEKLATFNSLSQAAHYFELFNRGNGQLKYNIKAPKFVNVSKTIGQLEADERITVSIDWSLAPRGVSAHKIVVSANDGSRITLPLSIDNRITGIQNIFVEKNGVISIEAPNYSRIHHNRPIFWKHIPNYGKTLGGMTVYPSTVPDQKLDHKTPYLEYDIFLN
ncbi:glycosyl hydrolase, partial [Pseudoxanthomonas sp. SGD-10]